MPKFGIVGDQHMKEIYGHSSDFSDHRIAEREEIEKAIHKATAKCDCIVLLGDNLHSRNNTSVTIRNFVRFLEGFGGKRIDILSGNHESGADGKTALDFLKEISGKDWHIHTVGGQVREIGDKKILFLPYQRSIEVFDMIGNDTYEAIFLHQAISGTMTSSNQLTDTFHEIILPASAWSKKAKRIFAGHIHRPQDYNENIHIVGAIMNEDLGEQTDKRVMIWDSEDNTVKSVKLPGRKLVKLVDPKQSDLDKIKDFEGLVQIMTEKKFNIPEGMAEAVKVLEMPKTDRKKVNQELTDFSIPNLLSLYAKERSIPIEELMKGWGLIEGL